MSYDDVAAVFDSFSPFTLSMNHPIEGVGNLWFTATIKFNADGFPPETVEATFQKFLDFCATSPEFTIQQATRVAVGVQQISPDAPTP